MKILYVTTIAGTMGFFRKFIESLIKDGHVVDIATSETNVSKVPQCYLDWGCSVHHISTSRSPFKKGNFAAIKQLRKIVEENGYDIVHCHTPIAAAVTRLACRKLRKKGLKVIYTAHGFHFYKGAPLKNWLLYYPVEKLCARYTDVLININTEDYELAKKKLKAKKVIYVPGVGIDLDKFDGEKSDRGDKREELGIPETAKLIISVGELNQNKNHETVIRAIADMKDVHYVIAGKGGLEDYLKKLIRELDMTDRVKLLGFRNDVRELCAAVDAFVFPSFREGLSVALMEAMAMGLPVACSRIRGNVDLIDENGGTLFDPHSVEDCRKAVEKLLNSSAEQMGLYNTEKIKKYEISAVNKKMKEIYSAL